MKNLRAAFPSFFNVEKAAYCIIPILIEITLTHVHIVFLSPNKANVAELRRCSSRSRLFSYTFLRVLVLRDPLSFPNQTRRSNIKTLPLRKETHKERKRWGERERVEEEKKKKERKVKNGHK